MYSNKTKPVLNVPLSTALFTVDTRDGLKSQNGFIVSSSNNSPYDINIQKGQQLFSGAVERISLTEINLPWFVPNVNTYNNVLFLENEDGLLHALGDDGITDELGVIQPSTQVGVGFFTPEELAVNLQSALNSANAGLGVFGIAGTRRVIWTVTYDYLTAPGSAVRNQPIFSIRNTSQTLDIPAVPLGPIPFRINPRINQNKGIGTNALYPGGDTNTRSDTLATMMGFSNASQDYSPIQNGNYASMLYTNYVDIVSSILCKNQDVRDSSTSFFNGNNILARLYIAGNKIQPLYSENVIYTSLGPSTEGQNTSIITNVVKQSTIIGTRPFHLHYEFDIPKEIQWNKEEFLPSCNIRLEDMYGNLLYTPLPAPLLSPSTGAWAGNSSYVELNMLISEAKDF